MALPNRPGRRARQHFGVVHRMRIRNTIDLDQRAGAVAQFMSIDDFPVLCLCPGISCRCPGISPSQLPRAQAEIPEWLSSSLVQVEDMIVPHNGIVIVADGANLRLFRNVAHQGEVKLAEEPAPDLGNAPAAGGHHRSSTANPDLHTVEEDAHAAAIARWLKSQVQGRHVESVVVIAAPRLLGEMRRHYNNEVTEAIAAELAKELAGHPLADIEAAVIHHR